MLMSVLTLADDGPHPSVETQVGDTESQKRASRALETQLVEVCHTVCGRCFAVLNLESTFHHTREINSMMQHEIN